MEKIDNIWMKIRERRRVFERMRGIGIDVTAAVRAEHLDRDLRRHRALHDVLFGHGLFFHDRFAVGVFDRLALVVLLSRPEIFIGSTRVALV